MKKGTKYKIYFSIWLLIISIALIFSPALRWNKNNEREITILNPKVERHFPFKRNSKDKFVFINKVDGARYPILCSSLKIDEKETFCDWYDGKNPEHKVYSIQKVSIVYLYSNWYKNRKIKKLSFMNEIEFLDKEKNGVKDKIQDKNLQKPYDYYFLERSKVLNTKNAFSAALIECKRMVKNQANSNIVAPNVFDNL